MNLNQTAALLLDKPGSLAYFLIIGMSLMMVFSMAQLYRQTSPAAGRWILTSSLLLTLFLFLIMLTLLSWSGWMDERLLPSLNRIASLFGLITLTTSLIFTRERIFRRFVLLIGIVCGLILAVSIAASLQMDRSTAFNHTWVDAIWSFSSVAAGTALVVTVILNRPGRWPLILLPTGLITAGSILHLSMGSEFASLAAFVRLAEISAYPLFAVLAVRSLAAGTEALPGSFDEEPSPPAWSELLSALEQLHATGNEEFHLGLVVDIARSLTDSFHADICLIFTAPGADGLFSIAAGYNRIQQHQIAESSLTPGNAPNIYEAMVGKQSFLVQDAQDLADTTCLEKILRRAIHGALLFAPFHSGSQIFGGALLLTPVHKTHWTTADSRNLEVIASLTADRLQRLTGKEKPSSDIPSGLSEQRMVEIERDLESLREILETVTGTSRELAERKEQLLEKYRRSQTELSQMRQLLTDLQRSRDSAKEERLSSSEELEQLELRYNTATEQLQQQKAVNRELRESLTHLQKNQEQLAELEEAAAEYETARLTLEELKELQVRLQQELDAAREQHTRDQHRYRELESRYQAARGRITELEEEVTTLKADLAETEQEARNESEGLSTLLKLVLEELAETRSNLSSLNAMHDADQTVLEEYSDLVQSLEKSITSLQGYTNLLIGESVGELGTMQLKFLERIHSSIEGIADMLADKQEPGKNNEIQGADLRQCLQQAASRVSQEIQDQALKLEFDLPDPLPAISCPAKDLENVLYAVLRDAVGRDATPEGLSIQAIPQSDHQDSCILLTISALAHSPQNDKKKLLFSQPAELGREDPGFASLGDAEQFYEKFGGRLWVDTAQGKTYSLLLPITQS